MEQKNHYATLGVKPSASIAEIKTAYKRLAMRLHPDRNDAPEAKVALREVQEAYDTLSDPAFRKNYDIKRNSYLLEDPLAVAKDIWFQKLVGGDNIK